MSRFSAKSPPEEDFGPAFTKRERDRGKPKKRHVNQAQECLRKYGFAVLDNALDRNLVLDLRRAYFERFGGFCEDELAAMGSRVGHERWMLSLPFEAPFDSPELFAGPLIYPIVKAVLGDDFVLNSFSTVTSFPGSEHQHVHRDHELLFPEDESTSFAVPPYAVTVAVPLVDLNETLGGTAVWPGSHVRSMPILARLKKPRPVRPKMGSAYLMDYRLLHGGEPNQGQWPRPIIYLVYARPWFADACNFKKHPPIRTTEAALEQFPEGLRHLFAGGLPPV